MMNRIYLRLIPLYLLLPCTIFAQTCNYKVSRCNFSDMPTKDLLEYKNGCDARQKQIDTLENRIKYECRTAGSFNQCVQISKSQYPQFFAETLGSMEISASCARNFLELLDRNAVQIQIKPY